MTLGLHAQAIRIINDVMAERDDLTQTELARRMGWTLKHVNRILKGHAEPSMASLDFMCFILGIEFEVRQIVGPL